MWIYWFHICFSFSLAAHVRAHTHTLLSRFIDSRNVYVCKQTDKVVCRVIKYFVSMCWKWAKSPRGLFTRRFDLIFVRIVPHFLWCLFHICCVILSQIILFIETVGYEAFSNWLCGELGCVQSVQTYVKAKQLHYTKHTAFCRSVILKRNPIEGNNMRIVDIFSTVFRLNELLRKWSLHILSVMKFCVSNNNETCNNNKTRYPMLYLLVSFSFWWIISIKLDYECWWFIWFQHLMEFRNELWRIDTKWAKFSPFF